MPRPRTMRLTCCRCRGRITAKQAKLFGGVCHPNCDGTYTPQGVCPRCRKPAKDYHLERYYGMCRKCYYETAPSSPPRLPSQRPPRGRIEELAARAAAKKPLH